MTNQGVNKIMFLVNRRESLAAGLFFALQSLFDARARLGGKRLRSGLGQFVGMFVRRPAKKMDLLSVTAAPFADQQVQPKTQSFGGRKRMVEGFGLKSGNITAGGRQRTQPGFQGGECFVPKIHL
jgi:hypothetical protein